MIILQQSHEPWDYEPTPEGMLMHIERCGRVCYQSENKPITAGTAKEFVRRLIDRGHESVLEHANMIFYVDNDDIYLLLARAVLINNLSGNGHLIPLRMSIREGRRGGVVSGNVRTWRNLMRVLHEDNCALPPIVRWYADFFPEWSNVPVQTSATWKPVVDVRTLGFDDRKKHCAETVNIITDRGITHELVRHRLMSFSQESTRYCAPRFGEPQKIKVIEPCFERGSSLYMLWALSCQDAEKRYFELLRNGAKPQEARSVLPTSTKAQIVVTGTLQQWEDLFAQRVSSAAHPQMRELMIAVQKSLCEKHGGE